MLPLFIYFFGIADKLISTAYFLSWILGIVSVIGLIIAYSIKSANYSDVYDEAEGNKLKERIVKYFKRLYIYHILCVFIYVLIPSSKTIACMYVIPQIASSKVIQQDLPEIYDMAVSALKENIKEAVK